MHSEQNGAPLEVTDGEGGLRWSGDYDTFGRLQGQTAAGIMQRRGAAYEQPLCYARQYRLSSLYPSLIIILPASGYDVSITTLKTATAG
nr:RHS domain-containing protein [Serratia rubidaea]